MNNAVKNLVTLLSCGVIAPQSLWGLPVLSQSIQGSAVKSAQPALIESETNALALRLIQGYYTALSATGSPTGTIGKSAVDDTKAREQVKALLDPEVIIQRADGDFFDHASFYPLDIDEFTIANLHATRPRPDLIVATYDISTPGAASLTQGVVYGNLFTPRLTTFRYNPVTRRWLLLSHASYNQPIQEICSHTPIHSASKSAPKNENATRDKLAKMLVENFYRDMQVQHAAVAHPGGPVTRETQAMTADGYRQKSGDQGRSVQVGPTQKRGFFITGTGNDLVVRYEAKVKGRIGGVEFTDDWHPRLATFSKDQNGHWTLASFASFNYPDSPPKNMVCAKNKK